MSEEAERGREGRVPLSRERVLEHAVAVADAGGLGSLTMRSLAKELGVRPMALYHHFTNKDEILDGIVDLVFSEVELPAPDGEWRAELSRRAASARDVLRRHSWAIALMESRSTPGPATLRHHEAVLATLRGAGLSLEMTGHAYALLDAFVYGFAIQEAALPFGPDTAQEVVASIAAQFSGGEYPYLAEYATERAMKPGYDFGDEFEFGLGVILDGLERLAGPMRVTSPRGAEA
ncbi:TetR/AcrR family transcriptional regulator [Georgenia sp. EYE_87]|uniref:TetR/AcrR family transcriptional regulator n=1 Tax=Georgenia sp. EYE_87 TaxID=2853448 RepID=UPI0020042BFD|nr:TetR/AcrR family transcriptional regulator [Georgenia sp. EYE_87]MCK6211397.1 TetR/AcrR family transcriptional regulator [Georgenia sp. EYE_87]